MKATIEDLSCALDAVVNSGMGEHQITIAHHLEHPWLIIPMMFVARDENGLWSHPLYPDALPESEVSRWLSLSGYHSSITYLLEPEVTRANASDLSMCRLRPPRGPHWFLFRISRNADGDGIALWISPKI